MIKCFRKLQDSRKMKETENSSTARDVPTDAPLMLTDEDMWGVKNDQQRAQDKLTIVCSSPGFRTVIVMALRLRFPVR